MGVGRGPLSGALRILRILIWLNPLVLHTRETEVLTVGFFENVVNLV